MHLKIVQWTTNSSNLRGILRNDRLDDDHGDDNGRRRGGGGGDTLCGRSNRHDNDVLCSIPWFCR